MMKVSTFPIVPIMNIIEKVVAITSLAFSSKITASELLVTLEEIILITGISSRYSVAEDVGVLV